MNIRSFFQAAKVEDSSAPYDTIHLRIFYPSQMSGSQQEQNLGIVPADSAQAPFEVVIFFNGVNCTPDLYQWLAFKLAQRGLVVVTFSWVAENIPGMIGLTPGVDLKYLASDTYGSAPTASALPTLLKTLEQIQSNSILAGLLNLERIILGGHSAGGRVAIESAATQFFPQVVASFAYAAHTAGAIQLGYQPGTICPLPDTLPLMLIGGTCDGVIAKSSDRYGVVWEEATTPIRRTLEEGFKGGNNNGYLVLLEGANHFSITYPFDSTTARPFLDFPATQPEDQLRDLIAQTIGLFIDAHVRALPSAFEALDRLLASDNPLIASWMRK
ncbi:conserved hypothetical protein [Gloeothece citriformis PCC 7424]|uniref:Uncharacterized protein n=1 Tax=Gloeothece citriformis (strain PCC 7424) TaxID=65393 RepID=B7K723_GLOC7|nr:alpha/beta fold hydrolase [Gloeothece citriformis]ACK72722.1 conserved hypothetical protein [Gloeothece citriformis PCC 7424]